MDLTDTIRQLRAERDRLSAVIAQLESLNNGSGTNTSSAPHQHRGRKFMGPAERRDVSDRMKRYWAKRRKAQGAA